MLKMMFRKLLSKKWMSVCLLVGILLLAATTVSFPLYRDSAFDRMLKDEFRNYLSLNADWPTKNTFVITSKKDAGGNAMSRMESLMSGLYDSLGVTEKETVYYYSLAKTDAISLMNRKDLGKLSLRVGFLSNLPDHAVMLAGKMYSESGFAEDGAVEALISQSCLVTSNLLVGETLEFPYLFDADGKKLHVRIAGVFGEEEDDFYWQKTSEQLNLDLLINESVFRDFFTGEKAEKYTITSSYYALFEYEDIVAGQLGKITEYTNWLLKESPYKSTMSEPAYMGILDSYARKQNRIQATLFLLQIPVLVLLGAFLLMISGQMYDMERNEISVMKSRGASGKQVLELYFFQSLFLSVSGSAAGYFLGILFAEVLGSARSFLEFDFSSVGNAVEEGNFFSKTPILYAVCALIGSVFIMTVPVIRHSKLTIVKLKQQKAAKKHSWWEKIGLDFICLGIALYGYYVSSKHEASIAESVLKGEAIEPLQALCPSLFIVGMGLLALRIQPLIIKLLFLAGKKFWRPASYISFMENEKNGRKQQFIMLFLILAVSLGMFYAVSARTILQNAKENASYLDGADFILREVWEDNSNQGGASGEPVPFRYYEPDFDKYRKLQNVESITKVIYDTKAYVSIKDEPKHPMILMGIHTKQFGENTSMPEGLLKKPYYEYLNELALNPEGVLVSADFRDLYGYEIGDSLTYYDKKNNRNGAKIVDFVEYWPGFEPSYLQLNPDGSVNKVVQSMIIANIKTLTMKWGTVPYEVWMTSKEGSSTSDFYRWLKEEKVKVVRFEDKQKDLESVVEDPLLQGTNGILTMGFLVILLLFAIGYLIYWILSIRSREMVFGILRANGMYKREIFHILINEQIFCGGFSVAAGILIGRLTCDMFVPILQEAYAAANQVLPMRLITDNRDLVRLYGVIFAVLAVCLFVLFGLVQKLNVAKALKLGEE